MGKGIYMFCFSFPLLLLLTCCYTIYETQQEGKCCNISLVLLSHCPCTDLHPLFLLLSLQPPLLLHYTVSYNISPHHYIPHHSQQPSRKPSGKKPVTRPVLRSAEKTTAPARNRTQPEGERGSLPGSTGPSQVTPSPANTSSGRREGKTQYEYKIQTREHHFNYPQWKSQQKTFWAAVLEATRSTRAQY